MLNVRVILMTSTGITSVLRAGRDIVLNLSDSISSYFHSLRFKHINTGKAEEEHTNQPQKYYNLQMTMSLPNRG